MTNTEQQRAKKLGLLITTIFCLGLAPLLFVIGADAKSSFLMFFLAPILGISGVGLLIYGFIKD